MFVVVVVGKNTDKLTSVCHIPIQSTLSMLIKQPYNIHTYTQLFAWDNRTYNDVIFTDLETLIYLYYICVIWYGVVTDPIFIIFK